MNDGLQRRTATTDSSGNFKVKNLDPTLHSLSASLAGYTTDLRDRNESPVYYRIGETVRLEMIRGGVITGTVTGSKLRTEQFVTVTAGRTVEVILTPTSPN
jgi:hypothetical protein